MNEKDAKFYEWLVWVSFYTFLVSMLVIAVLCLIW